MVDIVVRGTRSHLQGILNGRALSLTSLDRQHGREKSRHLTDTIVRDN